MRTPFRLLIAAASALVLGACQAQVSEVKQPARATETVGAPISPAQLAERIQTGPAPFILDVRTREEFEGGHIPGAVNISHDELPARLAELTIAKSEEVVVYCKSGRRAGIAETALRQNGFTNVRDLTGSWQAWQAAGLPSQ